MTTTLAVGATVVELSDDLFWSDEHTWHPVEQTAQRTITGALIISVATRLAGRPITLEPEDDDSAWMTKATLDQLGNWAAVPGQIMVLTLNGIERDVIFRHQDGAGVEARPVVHWGNSSAPESTDWYRVTLRLMEVETD